ncbi:hypothetical protein CS542_02455 [Pedobacter sp. IW39]|nr:hypothetical protein CS542_02455 [Pedobacter sp. IW39]
MAAAQQALALNNQLEDLNVAGSKYQTITRLKRIFCRWRNIGGFCAGILYFITSAECLQSGE